MSQYLLLVLLCFIMSFADDTGGGGTILVSTKLSMKSVASVKSVLMVIPEAWGSKDALWEDESILKSGEDIEVVGMRVDSI